MPCTLSEQKTDIKSLQQNKQVTAEKKHEVSDRQLPSLLPEHICNTAGGRNAPQLERKSTNVCEKSGSAMISVSSSMTKLITQMTTLRI